ncbi:shootin-1-like isoform X4 [Strix uralensis]|uniref:shootin-1-like isoform X4 n=1 Tax=Strix uralensis TaxID=36305 RepID=UPI003DA6EE43
MAWAGEGAGQLTAILESGSSEEEEEEGEEEEEEEDDDEEEDEEETAAVAQQPPPLALEVNEAEERLAELEQASQALLAELSALETEFEVERTCRQQAEAYAAQVKQENKQLKRLSLAPPAPPALPEEGPPEEDPNPAQEQLRDLQQKISWLLAQRKDLTIQLQDLQRHNQHLQDQLEMGQGERQRLRAALATSQRALKSSKRVSQLVAQDYWEALEQLELEQDLRLHAETFAHEMLVQQKEANRQSTILLQRGGPSAQLLAALGEVGRLTRALEEQQQRVKELEEQLGKRPELEELDLARAALAVAEDENLQLRKRLGEAEGRLAGLEEEAVPPPPPPPPLPPPAPAGPVDPLSAIRQRKGLGNPQRGKPEAADVKARAVQEMMERIKNGVVLRPAKNRAPLDQAPAPSKRSSAALELQSILPFQGAMRRASRRCNGRQSSRRGRDRQLESILQHRRRATDATLATPGPSQQDGHDAGAEGRQRPGDEDIGTAPSRDEDEVPFRARVASGLPRTRPLARGRGEPG